jgi:hypothetical protein
MRKAYYLISVSNRENLDLCIKHALAGFMNNRSGVWTFVEIQEGDLISFLYGARAHNLYVVRRKEAFKQAKSAPPWQPITFQQSGRTYDFPFRLYLEPIRELQEPLVRAEFAYVAENLLLRGGYRRTHFQADQTTLQAVSQMGKLWDKHVSYLDLSSYAKFTPHFTKRREDILIPEIFPFHEFILQALVRQYLCNERNFSDFFSGIANVSLEEFEVLGEKAFPEGHVDILIKEATPVGITRKIIIEVKTGAGTRRDLNQLKTYTEEIGDECNAAILIAKGFSSSIIKMAKDKQIKLASYTLKQLGDLTTPHTFEELLQDLILKTVQT